MLVPLTDSLYARGTLGNKGMVLIDIGTGYFAEVCDGQQSSVGVLSATACSIFVHVEPSAMPRRSPADGAWWPSRLPVRSTRRRMGKPTASERSPCFRRA